MRKILFGTLLLLVFTSTAQADFFDVADSGNGVVVENKQNIFQPYIKRRKNWGMIFGVHMENYQPKKYTSLLLNGNFETITGDATVPLISGELGLKYNFGVASIAAVAGYGMGNYGDKLVGLENFEVSIMKFSANFTLDGIMNEPYVAPYVQGGMHRFQVTEETNDGTNIGSESPTTTWNMHYRAGLLFQLNWIEGSIDPNSHAEGLRSSGLENTYLDVFYASYMSPSEISAAEGQSGEPDTASSHIGFGIKMEF